MAAAAAAVTAVEAVVVEAIVLATEALPQWASASERTRCGASFASSGRTSFPRRSRRSRKHRTAVAESLVARTPTTSAGASTAPQSPACLARRSASVPSARSSDHPAALQAGGLPLWTRPRPEASCRRRRCCRSQGVGADAAPGIWKI